MEKTFADLLAKALKEKPWSQAQLVEAVNTLLVERGAPPSLHGGTVTNYLSGTNTPRIQRKKIIAEALDLPVSALDPSLVRSRSVFKTELLPSGRLQMTLDMDMSPATAFKISALIADELSAPSTPSGQQLGLDNPAFENEGEVEKTALPSPPQGQST